MKRSAQIMMSVVGCAAAYGQGRPLDWPSLGGDAQRTGWEKIDTRITRDNVKDFQLVMKRKLGDGALAPPVVIGLLISYRGFKELAFVAGGANNMWAIDADLDRIFWQKHFDAPAASGPCAGGNAVAAALIPPTNFGARRPPGGPRPVAKGAGATPPSAPAGAPNSRGILGAGGFGAPRPVFAVSSDGKLHLMNTSTGDDVVPAMTFIPANSKASALTVVDNTVYTTTSPDCGDAGVWAMDLSVANPKVATYHLNGTAAGLAMGTDGTVYVQTTGSLVALAPKDLKLKQTIGTPSIRHAATPVVFAYKGRDVIASAGADGSISLFDSKAIGGDEKQILLSQSAPAAGSEVRGGLSTWLDTGGTRWIVAPVWGSGNRGSIVAYKVEDKDGKPVLTQGWTSREMDSPQPPVITAGVVFALSTGTQGHATLYALDGTTGKEIYSTGDQVSAPANPTGLTLANGRVFFTTTDGTLYGFGIHLEL